jgi:exosortase D (VPLPA-CTERM-specific)
MNSPSFSLRYGFYTGLALSLIAAIGISGNALLNLPTYWSREEYSHGYLLPLISVFIALHIIARENPEIRPSWLGLPVLILSLLLSVFAELSASEALLNYSFPVALWGVVLCFLGRRTGISLIPAFVLLFFAAPLPHFVYGNLSIQMQLLSSSIGTAIINLAGFPVFQDGNIIDLGHMKLQVAEACDGLRYLFPLLSLGFLTAYLMEDRLWKRVLVILSVLPITILMNSLRIGLIGVTVNVWGHEMAEGILHTMEGFVIFGICLAILLAEVALILKYSRHGRFRDEFLHLPSLLPLKITPYLSAPAVVATVLLLAGLVFFHSGMIRSRPDNTPTMPNLSGFPLQIDGWKGRRGTLTSAEIESLDLSDYWMADYKHTDTSPPVNFYVAYYNSQRMRANIHIPLNCIIGGGWRVTDQRGMDIDTSSGVIPVMRMTIEKQGQVNIVYYWLEQRGRRLNSALWAKLYMVWDAIVLQRTDGALVRLTTPLATAESMEQADERLQRFLQSTYPAVETFIPGR